MQEISRHGMTLRWSDALPSAHRKVFVEAAPVSPWHVVNIHYRINGGPQRLCRAWPHGLSEDGSFQTFAARLPDVPDGARLDWWPALCDGVREIMPETRPEPAPPGPQQTPAATQDVPPFPYRMERLARVTAPLEKTPTRIGDTPEGLMIVFPLGAGGTLRGPKLNGRIEHTGGDWMRVRPDGVGISEVRVVVDCDDGAKILGEYGGVVNFGRDGYAALSGGGGPKSAEVQLTPRFVTAESQYDWLNRVQCVGLGRVTMSTLLVEYDLYALRSQAIPEDGGSYA